MHVGTAIWYCKLNACYIVKTIVEGVAAASRTRERARQLSKIGSGSPHRWLYKACKLYLGTVVVVGDVAAVGTTSLIRGALVDLFSMFGFGASTSIILKPPFIHWRIVVVCIGTADTSSLCNTVSALINDLTGHSNYHCVYKHTNRTSQMKR